MPIYEYECLSCGKQCEVSQKFDDEPLSSCPDCGGHLHKLISHTSFILKGTGWFVTYYASSKKKKSREAEGKPDTKNEKNKPKIEATTKT